MKEMEGLPGEPTSPAAHGSQGPPLDRARRVPFAKRAAIAVALTAATPASCALGRIVADGDAVVRDTGGTIALTCLVCAIVGTVLAHATAADIDASHGRLTGRRIAIFARGFGTASMLLAVAWLACVFLARWVDGWMN